MTEFLEILKEIFSVENMELFFEMMMNNPMFVIKYTFCWLVAIIMGFSISKWILK